MAIAVMRDDLDAAGLRAAAALCRDGAALLLERFAENLNRGIPFCAET